MSILEDVRANRKIYATFYTSIANESNDLQMSVKIVF